MTQSQQTKLAASHSLKQEAEMGDTGKSLNCTNNNKMKIEGDRQIDRGKDMDITESPGRRERKGI